MIAARETLITALWRIAAPEVRYVETPMLCGISAVKYQVGWYRDAEAEFGRDDWQEFIAAKEEIICLSGRYGVRLGTALAHEFYAVCRWKKWDRKRKRYAGLFRIIAVERLSE